MAPRASTSRSPRSRRSAPTGPTPVAPTGRPRGTRGTRREQILRCAAQLFAARGFHGVSVDDLGAAAGVTGPALYRHFRAKEDILAELLIGVSERLLDGARRRVEGAPGAEGAPDAEDALAALVEFHVAFALDEPDVITVQERDLANLPRAADREVRALQHEYVSVWADVVDRVTGCGTQSAVAAAHAAFGLMNSTPHSARLPRAQMSALLTDMASAALQAAGRVAPADGAADGAAADLTT